MKRIKKVLILAMVMGVAVSAILIRTSGATSELNEYYDDMTGLISTATDNVFGQTFTPTKNGQLDKIEIYAMKSTIFTTDATAEIYATDSDGIITGTALGTSSTSTVDGIAWQAFAFAVGNRPELVAGSMYAILVTTSNYSLTYSFKSDDSYFQGTNLTDKYTKGTGDILFKTYLIPTEYVVSFMNGDTLFDTQNVEYGMDATPPVNEPEKAGYTFAYWDDYSVITENRMVYANYYINSYTISFDNNGFYVSPITQDYGTAVSAPANPNKTGYTFVTWCIDIGLETPYIFDTMPSEDFTLYAKWIVNQYTIAFNSNGGSSVNSITQNYLTSVQAPQVPTKADYTFNAWYKNSNLQTINNFPMNMPLGGTTLYAKWTIKSYTITFDSTGGTNVNPITKVFDATVTAPSPPTRQGYSFGGWYSNVEITLPYVFNKMPSGGITLYAKWIPQTPHYITYATNGSTNGSAPSDSTAYAIGSAVTTKANTGLLFKEGYGFSQWNTAADGSGTSYPVGTGTFAMGSTDITLYPIYVKTEVTLKDKTVSGFTVNIKGWQTGFIYQIWNYSEITSDIFLDSKERKVNQWLLAKACALGRTGTIQPDGSINYNISLFTSPDKNYTVAVRMANENSVHVDVLKDTLTESEYLKINKVKVDGVFADGTVTKEIKTGATATIEIITNITANTTYTVKVLETDQTITAENINNPGRFVWDISEKSPRTYTLRLMASNNGITDTREIKFVLYKTEGVVFASIDAMTMDLDSNTALPRSLTMTPNYFAGNFYYKISEPGRAEYFKSNTTTSHDPIIKPMAAYGNFMIVGITNRTDIGPNTGYYDDGIIKYVNVARSTSPSSITFTSDVTISPTVQKGTAILFTSVASIAGIGSTPVQYSFWRYDANGYSLVKDWATYNPSDENPANTLNWKPARVGEYTLQVRAKGTDALSYEVAKTINVKVVDTTERIAENVVISINSDELNANALARKAIVIKANVSSATDEDLLYNFVVSDPDMFTTVYSGYSTEPEYVWTPREARDYVVSVYVKNRSSFGKFDAAQSFTITVK
jgi:uncharacterized repeat protein (TIGR02543 family)